MITQGLQSVDIKHNDKQISIMPNQDKKIALLDFIVKLHAARFKPCFHLHLTQ